MSTISVSVNDFLGLCVKFASTIKHYFNRGKIEIISGEAELYEDGPKVHFTHDLSTCLLIISYQGVRIHQQEACTKEDIRAAFKRAEENFFLADFSILSSETVPFINTEKGRRYKKHGTSKRVIKNDDRGQHERWKERKARKTGTKYQSNSYRGILPDYEVINNNKRFRGKPVLALPLDNSDLEPEVLYDFPVIKCNPNRPTKSEQYIFLCEGMNVLIERGGIVGAVSFNPNYLGCRIMRAS